MRVVKEIDGTAYVVRAGIHIPLDVNTVVFGDEQVVVGEGSKVEYFDTPNIDLLIASEPSATALNTVDQGESHTTVHLDRVQEAVSLNSYQYAFSSEEVHSQQKYMNLIDEHSKASEITHIITDPPVNVPQIIDPIVPPAAPIDAHPTDPIVPPVVPVDVPVVTPPVDPVTPTDPTVPVEPPIVIPPVVAPPVVPPVDTNPGNSGQNNGWGNGDQTAPGNSASHNNAENNTSGKTDPSHGNNALNVHDLLSTPASSNSHLSVTEDLLLTLAMHKSHLVDPNNG